MYDFEESSNISLDEMVLALRCSISGLCKLSNINTPTEAQIEGIVALGFSMNSLIDENEQPTVISRQLFLEYCLNTPEIIGWLDLYDDIDDIPHDHTSLTSLLLLNNTITTTTTTTASLVYKESLESYMSRTVLHEEHMSPLLGKTLLGKTLLGEIQLGKNQSNTTVLYILYIYVYIMLYICTYTYLILVLIIIGKVSIIKSTSMAECTSSSRTT